MAKSKRTSVYWSLLILVVILVGFPLISLNYLNKGLDYRRSQLDKLDDLGRLPEFTAENYDGKTLNLENAPGKVIVFSHEKMACDTETSGTLHEYVEKFVNQDDFRHVVLQESGCPGWEGSYIADLSSNTVLDSVFTELTGMENLGTGLILADRNGKIRSIYSMDDKNDIESVVAHTTLLLPPPKKRG